MHAREKRFEIATHEDELPVEDEALLLQAQERLDDLREEAPERPLVAALQVDLVALAEGEAAKAVPLGLVEVAVERQLAREPRQHRLDRRHDRHPGTFPRSAAA
jgi:hypothetical protein